MSNPTMVPPPTRIMRFIPAVILLPLLTIAPSSHAMTITVGRDIGYDELTISAAMENITPPGKIIVAPGIYNTRSGETFPINFKSKITLVSASTEDLPIIGGNRQESVFSIVDVESATLDGFIITDGRDIYGAGAYIENSTIIIRNCIFEKNKADDTDPKLGLAGGIFAHEATCELYDCVFNDNEGWNGGARFTKSSVVLERCMFLNNIGYEVGGVMLGGGKVRIVDCEIVGNQANRTGGLRVTKSPYLIANSRISQNSGPFGGVSIVSHDRGGYILDSEICDNQGRGISCEGSILLSKVTVSGNETSPGNHGGGVFISAPFGSEIIDSTITANHASETGGGIYFADNYTAPCRLVGAPTPIS